MNEAVTCRMPLSAAYEHSIIRISDHPGISESVYADMLAGPLVVLANNVLEANAEGVLDLTDGMQDPAERAKLTLSDPRSRKVYIVYLPDDQWEAEFGIMPEDGDLE